MDPPEKKIKESKNITKNSKWYNFQVLTPTSAILRGTYSMSSNHFKIRSRGQQAAPSSVVAIVFARLFEPKKWTSLFIDRILESGDKLFRISQMRNRVHPSEYLTTSMVFPEFFISDYKILITTEKSLVYGNLFSETVGCPDLSEGLKRFFKMANAGVVTAQGSSVAIWQHKNQEFFYFDPSPCSETGEKNADGVSCVMRIKSINNIRDIFFSNLNRNFDSRYCIDKITVVRVSPVRRGINVEDKIDKLIVPKSVLRSLNPIEVVEKSMDCTKPVPKVSQNVSTPEIVREPFTISISNHKMDRNFACENIVDQNHFDTGYDYHDLEVNIPSSFKELPGDKEILHGWTHEGSDNYKGKGTQNVANCIMAIGMKKVHPVKTWLRPKLDEILELGDNISAEVKSKKPLLKTLNARDFNDLKIQIEGKNMFVDVDVMTATGTVSSNIPSVLNLKQALEEFFLLNTEGIIETQSMAVAIWMQEDDFYLFDPKQCDANGVRIIEVKGKSGGKGKKEDVTVQKVVKGKCCVIRFPNVDELVGQFENNLPAGKKDEDYNVRRISIMDDIPGTRPWNEFQPAEAGKTWILQGSISNDFEDFEEENRGQQGIAMPITFLINATENPPHVWTKETVNESVLEGNEFFNWCIPPEEEEDRVLSFRNLKNLLYNKHRKIQIDLQKALVKGDLTATLDSSVLNLEKALATFFETQPYGILETKGLAVGIWKYEEEMADKNKQTSYYILDPNPRDKFGKSNMEGMEEEPAACVIRTLDLKELGKIVEANIDPESEESNGFSIHSFKVVSVSEKMTNEEIEADKKIPIKPSLNAYTELGEDGAILNGSFNQSDICFKILTRNKQQAANALVTLGMSKIYNPHLWYREKVDAILTLGDKTTQDNLRNLPEEQEETEDQTKGRRLFLLPAEIDEGFNIGYNKITVNIEEEKSPPRSISELTQVLEEFFGENSMGILRNENIMLPIWKEGSVYFFMDPNGRDSDGEPKENSGASVCWFTSISSLSSSIAKSFESQSGNFIIDGVTLENEFETKLDEAERPKKTTSTENLWHHFPKKSEGIWELQGTISLKDERFLEENRGKQSAGVAAVSVIYSKACQLRQWSPDIVDEIIITGDELYAKSLARLGEKSISRINDIIPEYFLSNRRFNLKIVDCVESGYVHGTPNIQDLRSGFENFFKKFNSGVLLIKLDDNDINIGLWKAKDFFFCLLPDTINSQSSPDQKISSKASVFRFDSIATFVNHLKSIFRLNKVENEEHQGNIDFEISAVDVIDWNKFPPWKHDPSQAIRPSNLPPLNAYKQLENPARAILRGGVHQGSVIFSPSIRNRQTAANCIIALGMSVVKNPVTWTKKTLDEILVIGCGVHRESLKTTKIEKLKPYDIMRIFMIGVNVLTADVDESTISGIVAIAPPEPEVKGKGKKKEKKKKPPKAKKNKGKQQREPPPPPPTIYLEEGLKMFFEKNRAGVLVTGRFMIAIWKDQGIFFIYDPQARNSKGLADEDGTACVLWFACIKPLYDLIFSNIDESEKYGNFSICRTVIRTNIIEPLPFPAGFQAFLNCPNNPNSIFNERTITVDVEPLANFNIVDDEVSVLNGNYSMFDRIFDIKTRGLQSTAISAISIVVGLLHIPSSWTEELIDSVLKFGDTLHKDSVRQYRTGARNLSPSEILTTFIIGDFKATIHLHNHTVAGILLVDDLTQALRLFFKNHSSGILHTANYSVAVMQHYGMFYLFDPAVRSKTGEASYNGTACVIKCENLMRLARIFVNNCNYKVPTVYTINSVNVLNIKFFSKSSDYPRRCEK